MNSSQSEITIKSQRWGPHTGGGVGGGAKPNILPEGVNILLLRCLLVDGKNL